MSTGRDTLRCCSSARNSPSVGAMRCVVSQGSMAGRPSCARRYEHCVLPSLVICRSNTCALAQ